MVVTTRTTFDSYGRIYHANDKKYYSVTTILSQIKEKGRLKDIGKWWENKHGKGSWKAHCNAGMLLGTWFHWRAALDLCDELGLPYPEFEPKQMLTGARLTQYQSCIKYWSQIKEDLKPRPFHNAIEQFLYHSSGYAGRVDAIVYFDPKKVLPHRENYDLIDGIKPGEPWILDFKTSSAFFDDSHLAQLYAYREAWNERNTARPVQKMCVLRVHGKSSKTELRHWNFIEVDEEVAKDLWHKAMAAATEKGMI